MEKNYLDVEEMVNSVELKNKVSNLYIESGFDKDTTKEDIEAIAKEIYWAAYNQMIAHLDSITK